MVKKLRSMEQPCIFFFGQDRNSAKKFSFLALCAFKLFEKDVEWKGAALFEGRGI